MSQERVPRRFDADEIERARLTAELTALQPQQREIEATIARTAQRLRVGRHAAGRDTTGEVVNVPLVPTVREGGRPAVVARQDHERAMMRAKLLNGATAGEQLAEHLHFAYVQAAKPPLAKLGERVG
jgi:hypothetical protein